MPLHREYSDGRAEPTGSDFAHVPRQEALSRDPSHLRSIGVALAGLAAAALLTAVLGPTPLAFLLGTGVAIAAGVWEARAVTRASELFAGAVTRLSALDAQTITGQKNEAQAEALERWNAQWPALCEAIGRSQQVTRQLRELPERMDATFGAVVSAADRQEEAVEETASLVANMRQSMQSIATEVDQLVTSSEESASAILELGSSIDEVANNTAALHEIVDSSTASVHQMGQSIRQVADGAFQVQEIAESTASSMIQMDRSVQEVSSNALEAAALTERAHEGATAGRQAVRATISDIERISSLTSEAMARLGGLVSRISEIGNILGAIDEINDETNLLSLNAAIIAAQAGEQGKAFLVVANHVKTLARRTAGSTQDIERLIRDIEGESEEAVRAMQAGIEAVATGVNRSLDAGTALESMQEACSDASERVGEIARATAEQSSNSKGVAEATLRTSTEIQRITQAIAEQQRASEEMLTSAESALENCVLVHRSTDEQRRTSRHITTAIAEISHMIREIGVQTRVHGASSESVSSAVMSLLDNAQDSARGVGPLREWVHALDQSAQEIAWETEPAALGDSEESAETPEAPVSNPTA